MTLLPIPRPGPDAATLYVTHHLGGLYCDDARGSDRFAGGQASANEALARFDVSGYASRRNEVYPQPQRGASGLSPYIRHGLLSLQRVWDHVDGGPDRDVAKFRNELLWQEYARHWYLRLGARSARATKNEHGSRSVGEHSPPLSSGRPRGRRPEAPWNGSWNRDQACLELSVGELEDDGWLVNQTRMWLASHLTVREGVDWRDGEDYFFRHLLDGSRAANRLGWQWTTGVGSSKAYGFSRWQVEERAPGLCASCDLVHDCPIEDWPVDPDLRPIEQPVELRGSHQSELEAGPRDAVVVRPPDAVWLTAESLGSADPAALDHPDVPLVFVFDQRLLTQLQLSSKRLVFIVETLAELATIREVEVHVGDPVTVLRGRDVATTYAPVPGFKRRAEAIEPVALHPWPWLRRPGPGTVASFSAWLKSHREPELSVGMGGSEPATTSPSVDRT